MSYEKEINEKVREILNWSDQGAAYMNFRALSIDDNNRLQYRNIHTLKDFYIDINKSDVIKKYLDSIDSSDLYFRRDYCSTHLNRAIHEDYFDGERNERHFAVEIKTSKKRKMAP